MPPIRCQIIGFSWPLKVAQPTVRQQLVQCQSQCQVVCGRKQKVNCLTQSAGTTRASFPSTTTRTRVATCCQVREFLVSWLRPYGGISGAAAFAAHCTARFLTTCHCCCRYNRRQGHHGASLAGFLSAATTSIHLRSCRHLCPLLGLQFCVKQQPGQSETVVFLRSNLSSTHSASTATRACRAPAALRIITCWPTRTDSRPTT